MKETFQSNKIYHVKSINDNNNLTKCKAFNFKPKLGTVDNLSFNSSCKKFDVNSPYSNTFKLS